jgi:hypothetical protein
LLRYRNVFVFRADKRPNFVGLNPLAGKIHQGFVQELRAGRTDFNQQFRNRILRRARHADGGADRITFNQGRYDLGSFFGA